MNIQVAQFKIAGISAALPRACDDLLTASVLPEKERARFVETTGIRYRRIVPENTPFSQLCIPAAQALLAALQWPASSISAILVVTQSPDFRLPATACLIQHALHVPTAAACFDLNLGCSGYVYGLMQGALLTCAGGPGTRVLVVAGDVSSIYSVHDAATAPVFSDAATVTALEYDAQGEAAFFSMHTDGGGAQAICTPGGGSAAPTQAAHMRMQGLDVFRFSVATIPPHLHTLLQQAQISPNQLGGVYLHQANRLINQGIQKKLQWPVPFPDTLGMYGNTSSATIPLTLSAFPPPIHQPFVCSGFGVGLSWASCILPASAPVWVQPVWVD